MTKPTLALAACGLAAVTIANAPKGDPAAVTPSPGLILNAEVTAPPADPIGAVAQLAAAAPAEGDGKAAELSEALRAEPQPERLRKWHKKLGRIPPFEARNRFTLDPEGKESTPERREQLARDRWRERAAASQEFGTIDFTRPTWEEQEAEYQAARERYNYLQKAASYQLARRDEKKEQLTPEQWFEVELEVSRLFSEIAAAKAEAIQQERLLLARAAEANPALPASEPDQSEPEASARTVEPAAEAFTDSLWPLTLPTRQPSLPTVESRLQERLLGLLSYIPGLKVQLGTWLDETGGATEIHVSVVVPFAYVEAIHRQQLAEAGDSVNEIDSEHLLQTQDEVKRQIESIVQPLLHTLALGENEYKQVRVTFVRDLKSPEPARLHEPSLASRARLDPSLAAPDTIRSRTLPALQAPPAAAVTRGENPSRFRESSGYGASREAALTGTPPPSVVSNPGQLPTPRPSDAVARVASINQLRRVGLALLNYEAEQGHLPANITSDGSDRPLLSWRVALLPYLGEKALYERFKLDEPFDSPHNAPLMFEMPEAFDDPRSSHPREFGRTNYLAAAGSNAFLGSGKPRRLAEIVTGTSNAIAVVEVQDRHAHNWTRPADYLLNAHPGDPRAGIGSFDPSGDFLALFADGSIRNLPGATSGDRLRQMLIIDDRLLAPPPLQAFDAPPTAGTPQRAPVEDGPRVVYQDRNRQYGYSVNQLQERLNEVLDPSPALQSDGDYGPKTTAAVRRFQRQAKLPSTGFADPATRAALGFDEASPPAFPPVPNPPVPNPPAAVPADPPVPPSLPIISPPAPLPPETVEVTGIMSAEDAAKLKRHRPDVTVEAYQESTFTDSEGPAVVRITQQRPVAEAERRGREAAAVEMKAAAARAKAHELKRRALVAELRSVAMKEADVVRVAKQLVLADNWAEVEKRAAMALHERVECGEGLGASTYNALNDAYGYDVKVLQAALNKRLDPSPALELDGDYGKPTALAVARFQRAAKVPATGYADEATRGALGLADGPVADSLSGLGAALQVDDGLLGLANRLHGLRHTIELELRRKVHAGWTEGDLDESAEWSQYRLALLQADFQKINAALSNLGFDEELKFQPYTLPTHDDHEAMTLIEQVPQRNAVARE